MLNVRRYYGRCEATIQLAPWKRGLREPVPGASEHPELGTAWIFELGRPEVTFELFSPNLSERLGTSDAKLAGGLGSFGQEREVLASRCCR